MHNKSSDHERKRTPKTAEGKDRLYMALYRVFHRLVTRTPETIRFPLLRATAFFVRILDRKHRRIALTNLDIAFGDEMSPKEKERIVKKTYENLLFNLADFVAHTDETPEELMKRVTVENIHHLEEARKGGKPVVLIGAHYGNWEMLPRVFASLIGPTTVVGRPLDSRAMNEVLMESRNRFGIEIVPKKGALRPLMSALKRGRSVGLIVDQNTSRHDGITVEFFGKKVRHTPAAAILARRFDLAVLPVFITTDDHRRYTVTIEKPLYVPKSDDIDEDIARNVQEQADVTERTIRKKPEEWFWLHKRWRAYHKELYERSGAA